MDGRNAVSDVVLPDWVFEGAQVWMLRTRGNWGSTPDPTPVTVVRFTAQRVIVNQRGEELSFLKDNLNGIGKASDSRLISDDATDVVNFKRKQAVRGSMSPLRGLINDLLLGNRIGWDELPDALEAALMLRNAAEEAVWGLERAADRYGEGLARKDRR